MKDRIQRMVTGQITDQMGKPVTASPVSTLIYDMLYIIYTCRISNVHHVGYVR